MPEFMQRFKLLMPLGGALVFAGIAGYLYYKLFQKDEELNELSEQEKIIFVQLTKVEIKIPKKAVGAVIGRQGANIKQIQERTSTSINFRDDDENERTCIIRGKVEKVEKAKELILKAVQDLPVIESLELHVPNEAVGRIIGRNGEMVHYIQRITGAKIKVYNHNDQNASEEGSVSESTRKIVIKGTVEQLTAAKLNILEKVEEEQQMREQIRNSASHISQRSKTRHQQNGSVPALEETNQMQTSSAFPQTMSNKTYNEVFVSAVDTATHFWVQVLGSKTIELDKLVSEMTEYYDDPNNKEHHIPDKIKPGDIVAAKFPIDNMWYRGRICEPCESVKNHVYFVDFGDADVVDAEDICELRTDFLKLGFQAVECYLANIDPASANSSEAIEAFESLTYSCLWVPVMVRVLGYKQEGTDTVPFVRVVDTNGLQDIDVAEELVKRGLASWTEEKFTSLSSSLTSLSEAVSI